MNEEALELKKWLEEHVKSFTPGIDNPDAKSWAFEEGIVISVNDAKLILEILNKDLKKKKL